MCYKLDTASCAEKIRGSEKLNRETARARSALHIYICPEQAGLRILTPDTRTPTPIFPKYFTKRCLAFQKRGIYYKHQNSKHKTAVYMKGSDLMMKNTLKRTIACIMIMALVFGAAVSCGDNNTSVSSSSSSESITSSVVSDDTTEAYSESESESTSSSADSDNALSADAVAYSSYSEGILDTSDIFSQRDLTQTADLSEAEYITVSDGEVISITEAGIYVISGTASDCTITVNADTEAKVQLVLDGVNITNSDFPAIYVISADKVFITTTDSSNTLSVTGTFTSDGDTNTDAVIFSKDDLVLNGTGTLNITSAYGNGITSKDDLRITGGTYNITSAQDSLEANDSIAICGGTFSITSDKDALHCENDEDDTVGYIYIADGTFNITSSSDGIQGTTIVQIDGGDLTISSAEGIESTYIQINGGNICIESNDDGINASRKSSAYDVVVEFNGGYTTIVMGSGDVDGVDSNGSIYVNGGTVDITISEQGMAEAFDFDYNAEINGGTVIVNGEERTEITSSMMGGGFGGGGNWGGNGGFGRGNFSGGNGGAQFNSYDSNL